MGLLDRGLPSLMPHSRSKLHPIVLGVIIVAAIITAVAVLPGYLQVRHGYAPG